MHIEYIVVPSSGKKAQLKDTWILRFARDCLLGKYQHHAKAKKFHQDSPENENITNLITIFAISVYKGIFRT